MDALPDLSALPVRTPVRAPLRGAPTGDCLLALTPQIGNTCYFMAARAAAQLVILRTRPNFRSLADLPAETGEELRRVFNFLVTPLTEEETVCIGRDPEKVVPASILETYRQLARAQFGTVITHQGKAVEGIFEAIALMSSGYLNDEQFWKLVEARNSQAHWENQEATLPTEHKERLESLAAVPKLTEAGVPVLLFLAIMRAVNMPFYIYADMMYAALPQKKGDVRTLSLIPGPELLFERYYPPLGTPFKEIERYLDAARWSSQRTAWKRRKLVVVILMYAFWVRPGQVMGHAIIIAPCNKGYAVCDSRVPEKKCAFSVQEYVTTMMAEWMHGATLQETLLVWIPEG